MRAFESSPLPCPHFWNEDGLHLVVCGQGSLLAAICTSGFLSRESSNRGALVVANFGLAGSRQEDWSIGESLMINHSSGESSSRAFFPERLIRHPWPESRCHSVSQTANLTNSSPMKQKCVYDMEAFAIATATESYLSSSQLVIGKFVSDHLQDDELCDWRSIADRVQDDFQFACMSFLKLVQSHHDILRNDPRRKKAQQTEAWWSQTLESLTSELTITVTQQRLLKKRLQAYALGCQALSELEAKRGELKRLVLAEKGETKSERNQILEKVLQRLATPPLFSPVR